jgi:hypothetical protein
MSEGQLPKNDQREGISISCGHVSNASEVRVAIWTRGIVLRCACSLLWWVLRGVVIGLVAGPIVTWFVGRIAGWITLDTIIFLGAPYGVVVGIICSVVGWLVTWTIEFAFPRKNKYYCGREFGGKQGHEEFLAASSTNFEGKQRGRM